MKNKSIKEWTKPILEVDCCHSPKIFMLTVCFVREQPLHTLQTKACCLLPLNGSRKQKTITRNQPPYRYRMKTILWWRFSWNVDCTEQGFPPWGTHLPRAVFPKVQFTNHLFSLGFPKLVSRNILKYKNVSRNEIHQICKNNIF